MNGIDIAFLESPFLSHITSNCLTTNTRKANWMRKIWYDVIDKLFFISNFKITLLTFNSVMEVLRKHQIDDKQENVTKMARQVCWVEEWMVSLSSTPTLDQRHNTDPNLGADENSLIQNIQFGICLIFGFVDRDILNLCDKHIQSRIIKDIHNKNIIWSSFSHSHSSFYTHGKFYEIFIYFWVHGHHFWDCRGIVCIWKHGHRF